MKYVATFTFSTSDDRAVGAEGTNAWDIDVEQRAKTTRMKQAAIEVVVLEEFTMTILTRPRKL
jgi:hypothetical protein